MVNTELKYQYLAQIDALCEQARPAPPARPVRRNRLGRVFMIHVAIVLLITAAKTTISMLDLV